MDVVLRVRGGAVVEIDLVCVRVLVAEWMDVVLRVAWRSSSCGRVGVGVRVRSGVAFRGLSG